MSCPSKLHVDLLDYIYIVLSHRIQNMEIVSIQSKSSVLDAFNAYNFVKHGSIREFPITSFFYNHC